MPSAPGSGRGQPAFDAPAQEVLGQIRGQHRFAGPLPGYEPAPLTAEEQAEAKRIADEAARDALICRFCASVHVKPNTPSCPRLASFELDGDGNVKAGTFWPGDKWKRGRVVPAEDLYEEAGDDGAAAR
jgi:hypothetical protein